MHCIRFTGLVLLLITLGIGTSRHVANAQKITVTGHRGAAAIAPENTMESVRKAILLGVDRVEIDVHQTKDGEIVVIHDHTLDRTTNGSGKIKDYTYQELKEFKIDGSTEHISTLQGMMDLTNNKTILVIELKKSHGYYEGIEEKVLKIIKENEFQNKCLIHAFDTKVLKVVHKLDPRIELHKLVIAGFLTNFKGLDFVSEFSLYTKSIKKRHIEKIHALGKKVNVWTVNDSNEITKLVAWGVDGVITDDPGIILDRQR